MLFLGPTLIIQTIKECTADMDSDTWNAYHIISNRAHAVCYSVRQQLFRLRAEHTVNALLSTATSQLDAMEDLKVDCMLVWTVGTVPHLCFLVQTNQLELKELTAASLDKLLDGHKSLQTQQRKLYEGQEQMESSLRDNLQRLSQEKALIASGQELVGQLIQGIMQRMGRSFAAFLLSSIRPAAVLLAFLIPGLEYFDVSLPSVNILYTTC